MKYGSRYRIVFNDTISKLALIPENLICERKAMSSTHSMQSSTQLLNIHILFLVLISIKNLDINFKKEQPTFLSPTTRYSIFDKDLKQEGVKHLKAGPIPDSLFVNKVVSPMP